MFLGNSVVEEILKSTKNYVVFCKIIIIIIILIDLYIAIRL